MPTDFEARAKAAEEATEPNRGNRIKVKVGERIAKEPREGVLGSGICSIIPDIGGPVATEPKVRSTSRHHGNRNKFLQIFGKSPHDSQRRCRHRGCQRGLRYVRMLAIADKPSRV